MDWTCSWCYSTSSGVGCCFWPNLTQWINPTSCSLLLANTPFMALAYLCREDYAAGGFRMFSLTDASGQRTASTMASSYCLYLVPLGYLAYDWGLTSGWFCLESTLLTLAISGTAFSFYHDRMRHNARRMFYGSLLYLPVFMSGILFHRISDDKQCISDKLDNVVDFSSSLKESRSFEKKKKSTQVRPPVAYASVAPFPFLPAPSYSASQ